MRKYAFNAGARDFRGSVTVLIYIKGWSDTGRSKRICTYICVDRFVEQNGRYDYDRERQRTKYGSKDSRSG